MNKSYESDVYDKRVKRVFTVFLLSRLSSGLYVGMETVRTDTLLHQFSRRVYGKRVSYTSYSYYLPLLLRVQNLNKILNVVSHLFLEEYPVCVSCS